MFGRTLAQGLRDPDALVALARRHPDVGDQNVGALRVDGPERFVVAAGGGDDLEVAVRGQELHERLADEVAVVGDDDPCRHAKTITPEARDLTRIG